MRAVLVMGGGGLKGLAHIGAWRAVQEAGLEVAGIVGTSIGALIGACLAGGRAWRELQQQAAKLTRSDIVALDRWTLLINGIRHPSVFLAEPYQEYIRTVLPVASFHELELALDLNAVDLETGAEVWFGNGGRSDVALADAVYASSALPLFYPPARINGRYYVDGGVADSLPIRQAALRDSDLIVAVDVGAGPQKDSLDTVSKGLVAIHHRVYDIMNYQRQKALLATWNGPPLAYVRPRLDGYSTFDFDSTAYFIDEGYRATREALGRVEGLKGLKGLRGLKG
jgi:NTE family protein